VNPPPKLPLCRLAGRRRQGSKRIAGEGVLGERPIEDDFDLARVVTAGFARQGVHIVHASTGAAALELARSMNPDLVILDLVLPDMDGFAVVDWLKDNDRLQSTPLVVYSAREPTASERSRLALGPTEFLTKSRILPEEFERRVIQLLNRMIPGPPEGLSRVA
jgi:DNA-binding response OmpR family regulator